MNRNRSLDCECLCAFHGTGTSYVDCESRVISWFLKSHESAASAGALGESLLISKAVKI
ncbi:hypothetical protein HCQ94_01780 [Actinomyces sp. zg-332]|uniref:hypothetical protein n=1 Tax=Actinomyces sp. zg-332 TaxID=2708340 RepID=UPI00141EC4DE|nr:hypothetical protein [Actinomyces sp. zg-332]QPK94463.1 hypothetical protein HCQ94_01780 [Actinomyces sp. zg-332]